MLSPLGIIRRTAITYNQCSFHVIGFGINDPHLDEHSDKPYDKTTKSLNHLYEKYEEVKAISLAGGGTNALKKHELVNKKLSPRRRMELLFDNCNYREIMWGAGYQMDYGTIPSGGAIVGVGKVNGRTCLGVSSEATFKGGSVFPIGVKKQLRVQELSMRLKLPSLYIVDSAGGFLPLQDQFFCDADGGGRVFANLALLGAAGVHQLSFVGGSSTAGGAYLPTMTSELVMARGAGHIFLGGPPLVRAATGEVMSAEELGGADLHSTVSGVSDHLGRTEHEAMETLRSAVETLPQQRMSEQAAAHLVLPAAEPLFPAKRLREVAGVINRSGTVESSRSTSRRTLHSLLACLLDSSRLHEFMPRYGDSVLAGFGRIRGHMTAWLGCCGRTLDKKDALKAGRLLQLCQQRGLPLISLIHTSSTPAVVDGVALRAKAKLMSLMNTVDIPRVTVLLGNALHEDYYLLGAPSTSPVYTLAWPTAQFADKDAFQAAGQMWVDEVILPEETRDTLIFLLDLVATETPGEPSHKNKSVLRM